jgi:hypothetical protein
MSCFAPGQITTRNIVTSSVNSQPPLTHSSFQSSGSVATTVVGGKIQHSLVMSNAAVDDDSIRIEPSLMADGVLFKIPKAPIQILSTGGGTLFDSRISDVKRIKVKESGAGTGEFLSIADALASISTKASETNLYLVDVGPGIFYESELAVPDYVSVKGSSYGSTIIKTETPASFMVKMGKVTELSFLTIDGGSLASTGVIVHDVGDYSQLYKISVVNCGVGIDCKSTTINSYCYLEYVDVSETFVQGLKIESSNNFSCNCDAENFYLIPSGQTVATGILVHGSMSTANIRSSGFYGIGNFGESVRVTHGSHLSLASTKISDWDMGINVDQEGTNPDLVMMSIQFLNNNTHYAVNNTTATGYFTGYSETSKTIINKSSSFFVTNKDNNIIRVSKRGGDYTSIQEAIDSITDASATNKYTVSVGPGIFVGSVVLKPHVSLRGFGGSTVIQSSDSSSVTITGSDHSSVSQCYFSTPNPTVSHIAVHLTGGNFRVDNVSFGSCYRAIFCEATTAPIILRLHASDISLDNGCHTFAEFTDNGVYSTSVQMSTIQMYSSTEPYFGDFVKLYGTNTSIELSGGVIKKIGSGAGTGTAVTVYNGAKTKLSGVEITGLQTGIHVPNIGSAPGVFLSGVSTENNINDIIIEHPNTSGAVSGVFTKSKVLVDSGVIGMSFLYADPTNQGTVSVGKFYMGEHGSDLTDVSDLIHSTPAMGIIEGGIVSIGTGLSVNIGGGFGYIVDGIYPNQKLIRVDWNATSIVLPQNGSNYIFINSSKLLTYSASQPSTKSNLLLGRVVTDSTGIEFVDVSPFIANHATNNQDLFNRQALGPIYDTGSLVTSNGSRELTIGSGVYFFSGNKFLPSGSIAPTTFKTYYRTSTTGFVKGVSTIVDNSRYDNGSGTLTPITNGYFAKHSLYLVGQGTNEQYMMVYAQSQHQTQVEAESANIPFPPSYFDDGVVLIASIIVQQGNPSIMQIKDERPVVGFKASGVSAASNHGNLLGLLDDDHPQYLLANGSRTMSGSLNMSNNNIVNAGLVNNVNITSHSSRHLPNGLDALATAAPSRNLRADSNNVNGIGIANSFSRSDHIHAVDVGTSVDIQTISTTNSGGSSALLARADHVHSHGNLAGGSLHAVATQNIPGFMSASDKIKLDGLSGTTLYSTYGNGLDGNSVLSGSVTLIRDMYYDNLTLETGCILNPNGYRIFVRNILKLNGGCSIIRNGNNASGPTAGAALAFGTLGGSGAGGNGRISSFGNGNSAGTVASGTQGGGVGGAGGSVGNRTGGSVRTTPSIPTTNDGGLENFYASAAATRLRTLGNLLINGGDGGSGGGSESVFSTSGGGGSGGGVIMICARSIVYSGTTNVLVYARGGNGGNATAGSASGGGGGGGGLIVFISSTDTTTIPQIIFSVAGGIGGSGIGSGISGSNGGTGNIIKLSN